MGDTMKSSKEILSSVLKTTQIGQIGIRSVLDTPIQPQFRNAIQSQLREYDSIETEAHRVAQNHGWKLSELNPSIRFMTDRMAKIKLAYGNRESKAAAMMIRGNTNGIIICLKNLHQASEYNETIAALSQKLLETEAANVQQMKPFL